MSPRSRRACRELSKRARPILGSPRRAMNASCPSAANSRPGRGCRARSLPPRSAAPVYLARRRSPHCTGSARGSRTHGASLECHFILVPICAPSVHAPCAEHFGRCSRPAQICSPFTTGGVFSPRWNRAYSITTHVCFSAATSAASHRLSPPNGGATRRLLRHTAARRCAAGRRCL